MIGRFAPGLSPLLNYRREWLRDDVVAGISVAAVAVPTAIAYAQLIGFDPIVGLYAAILPLVAYALFGTSRQLIVNPDAATCAVFAAAVLPLAAGGHQELRAMSVALAVLTGLVCMAAGLLRLGFVADFLGKPILVGYLNGVAISIFLGQIGKVFGFSMHSRGIVPRLIELIGKLPQTHLPTLSVGLITLTVILAGKHWWPRAPAPLLAMLVGGDTGLWVGPGSQRRDGRGPPAQWTAGGDLPRIGPRTAQTPPWRRLGRRARELQQRYGDGKEFCGAQSL